jgi:hypothetical protein
MAVQTSPAVAVASAHVEAWGRHDHDAARASLANDVHVLAATVDPMPPRTDTIGIEAYMEGLLRFTQGVLPGTTRVTSAIGDERRALLEVNSRVKFGPDAPEMTLYGTRLYRLNEDQKIEDELVIFFVLPE